MFAKSAEGTEGMDISPLTAMAAQIPVSLDIGTLLEYPSIGTATAVSALAIVGAGCVLRIPVSLEVGPLLEYSAIGAATGVIVLPIVDAGTVRRLFWLQKTTRKMQKQKHEEKISWLRCREIASSRS